VANLRRAAVVHAAEEGVANGMEEDGNFNEGKHGMDIVKHNHMKAASPESNHQEDLFPGMSPRNVLDSINDGIYVTDINRCIIYWNKSAERITGWSGPDVIGRTCFDDILCHVDKDQHQLCGEEFCPLHRSMVTGHGSQVPIVVFARRKQGGTVPLKGTVAPILDAAGKVVGGVETFRDLSADYSDLRKAQKIQSLALPQSLPEDSRLRFTAHYVPLDIVGGDYYAVEQVDAHRYAFLLADVSGHGVPAALYTMYLSSIWQHHRPLFPEPARLAAALNQSLYNLIMEDCPFAAGMCGTIDLEKGILKFAGAGNPFPLLFHTDGTWEKLDCSGLPLGILDQDRYEEARVEVRPGDVLLFFTDGAVEIKAPSGDMLGTDGLVEILRKGGYPQSGSSLKQIEKAILVYSDGIRLADDLTLLEIRLL